VTPKAPKLEISIDPPFFMMCTSFASFLFHGWKSCFRLIYIYTFFYYNVPFHKPNTKLIGGDVRLKTYQYNFNNSCSMSRCRCGLVGFKLVHPSLKTFSISNFATRCKGIFIFGFIPSPFNFLTYYK
jgi:hypothetical protein